MCFKDCMFQKYITLFLIIQLKIFDFIPYCFLYKEFCIQYSFYIFFAAHGFTQVTFFPENITFL